MIWFHSTPRISLPPVLLISPYFCCRVSCWSGPSSDCPSRRCHKGRFNPGCPLWRSKSVQTSDCLLVWGEQVKDITHRDYGITYLHWDNIQIWMLIMGIIIFCLARFCWFCLVFNTVYSLYILLSLCNLSCKPYTPAFYSFDIKMLGGRNWRIYLRMEVCVWEIQHTCVWDII